MKTDDFIRIIFIFTTILLFGFIFGFIFYLYLTQSITGNEGAVIGYIAAHCFALVEKTFYAILNRYFNFKIEKEECENNDQNQIKN